MHIKKKDKEGRNWDQSLSESLQQELQCMDGLDNMTSIQFLRCLILNINGNHELHMSTDASDSAVAATVFVRTTNANRSSVARSAKQKRDPSSS